MQSSGHVDDDTQISALDVSLEMDGQKSRYIQEVLNWYREQDAGDFRRHKLNELVEHMTALNALERKLWKSKKVGKVRKSNQNNVMNETFVRNNVMNEKFVQIILTNAKIDPKVVMYLSIFKIGGWNNLQRRNRNLFEEFLDENEPWLLD